MSPCPFACSSCNSKSHQKNLVPHITANKNKDPKANDKGNDPTRICAPGFVESAEFGWGWGGPRILLPRNTQINLENRINSRFSLRPSSQKDRTICQQIRTAGLHVSLPLFSL